MSSDDDQDIAALEAALARAHAKKQRKLDDEQRRRDSGPQELVPGTPSPRACFHQGYTESYSY